MSSLVATIREIRACESLHIVRFEIHGTPLSMVSLALSPSLQVGSRVSLTVNPTHIAIGREFSGEVSYSNQLPTSITTLTQGVLLTTLKLQFFETTLESIITTDSAQRMNLKEGDKVTAFIKATELAIGEVLNV